MSNTESACVITRARGFDLPANLISTKVSASHRKSTQVHASPGQTKSQIDPSLQLASTCDSVWPGLYTKKLANRGFKPL